MLLLVSLFAIGLAACEPDADEPDDVEAPDDEDVVEIELEAGDMYFEPDEVEVPAGATVEFTIENVGDSEHDLTFEDPEGQSDPIAPGETGTVEIGPFEEDTVGWCSFPGHREAGQEIDVVVTD